MNNRLPHSLIRIYLLTAFGLLILPMAGLCQTPINCGDTVTAGLAGAVTNSYAFSGTAGETAVLVVHTVSGSLCATAVVLDPNGSQIGSVNCGATGRTSLPVTGGYTIRVFDPVGRTGQYAVTLQFSTGRCGTPIACGQLATNALEFAGNTDAYTFTANAGDVVAISVRSLTSNLCAFASLSDPAGNRLIGTGDPGANCDCGSRNLTLTATGTYTVLVLDPRVYASQGIGPYTVVWYKLNSDCNGAPVGCGEIVRGTLSSGLDTDYYSITAEAGDLLEVRLTEPFPDSILELYDSAGQLLSAVTNYYGEVVLSANLAASGIYGVRVHSDYYHQFEGDYGLVWQKLNNPCHAPMLACGQSLTVTNPSPTHWDFYRFNASAGDVLGVGMDVETSQSILLSLYDSTGGLMGTCTNNPLQPLFTIRTNLVAGGAYSLTVRDATWNASFTGRYSVVWQRLADPCRSTTLDWGQTVTVTNTQPYQVDTYTLPAIAGEMIFVTLVPLQLPDQRSLELYSPRGTLVGLGSSGPVTLAGDYTLIVRNKASSPGYSLTRNYDGICNPRIESVTPSKGCNVTVGIKFRCVDLREFSGSAIPKLTRAGYQDIVGTPTAISLDGTTLFVRFDLRGAELGVWDLVVILPDGRTAPKSGAFTVVDCMKPVLWTQVIGLPRPPARRPAYYTVRYGNDGFVDATNVVVALRQVPPGIVLKVEPRDPVPALSSFSFTVAVTPLDTSCFDLVASVQSLVDESLAASNQLRVCPGIPIDPNDKAGPVGDEAPGTPPEQQKHFVTGDHALGYMVFFENLSNATAAVQDMLISDPLAADLDPATFQLEAVQVGTNLVSMPAGSQLWTTNVDCRPAIEAIVHLDCRLTNGVAQWYLAGLNPTNLAELADFLPPNTPATDPQGRGWVSYSVKPKRDLLSGTIVTNQATIDFEVGIPPAPMDTPVIFNTLDTAPPTSHVTPLPTTSTTTVFSVSWTGSDDPGGSGVRDYSLFVSDNDGLTYANWLVNTTATSGTFTGQLGMAYAFYSVARDNVDNQEGKSARPEATTQVPLSAARDLAVTSIKAPKKVTLTGKKPSLTRIVGVQIQNNSPHTEVISNATVLADLVTLSVEAITNTCSGLTPTLRVPTKLPIRLKPKGKLTALFNVTFSTNCVPDSLPTPKTGSHNDYRYSATVNLSALGALDTNPGNDDCPRPPNPATGDKGCGNKNHGGSLGADVLTDVVVKSSGR